MVDAELGLEALGGPGEGYRHHAGVVDQYLDRLGRLGGEGLDRVQTGQVELADVDLTPDLGGRPLPLADVADGQGDVGHPAPASIRAASNPIPLLPPVIIQSPPALVGQMSSAVHCGPGMPPT